MVTGSRLGAEARGPRRTGVPISWAVARRRSPCPAPRVLSSLAVGRPTGQRRSMDDSRSPGRPRVLVAYATAEGSTADIAEHIAETLRDDGAATTCRPEIGRAHV